MLNHMERATLKRILWCIVALVVTWLCIMFSSCATRKQIEYVDRVVVQTEVKETHDTVTNTIHDSIYHTILQKGDTVYNTKFIERTKYKTITTHSVDTLWRDSIQTKIEKVVVEKKIIPKWCYYTLVGCAILIIFVAFRVRKWLKMF